MSAETEGPLWRVAWRYVAAPPPGQAAAGHGEWVWVSASLAQLVANWSNDNVLPRGELHFYVEQRPEEGGR